MTIEAGDAGEAGKGGPGGAGLRMWLRGLYLGRTVRSHRFRLAMMVFDAATILFIVTTSFLPSAEWIESLDLVFGAFILADYVSRLVIARRPLREFFNPLTLVDLVAVLSFLAPLAGEGLGFLRVLRTFGCSTATSSSPSCARSGPGSDGTRTPSWRARICACSSSS